MTISLVGPQRGSGAQGAEVALVGAAAPFELYATVEKVRDEREGLRPMKYLLGYKFTFADIPACTAAGGIGGGAGTKVLFPALPPNARVTDFYLEIVTALVNSAGTQDVDGAGIVGTELIADAAATAAVGLWPGGTAKSVNLPLVCLTSLAPYIFLAGANLVTWTEGVGILWIEVIGYFQDD